MHMPSKSCMQDSCKFVFAGHVAQRCRKGFKSGQAEDGAL